MKKNILSILVMIISLNIYGQNLNIEFNAGMGTYKMQDLKDLNTVITDNMSPYSENSVNFPMTFYYKTYITYYFKGNVSAGIFYSYNSTNSQVRYNENSAEYIYDNDISSNIAGINMRYKLFDNNFKVCLYGDIAYSFSKLHVHEELHDVDFDGINNEDLVANSIIFEPGIRTYYDLKFLKFGIYFGYLYDFKHALHLEGDPDAVFDTVNSDDELIKEDWGGIRFGVSLSVKVF